MTTTPIYTGNFGQHRLRFFAPPNGELELPWVAEDDLIDALKLRPDQVALIRKAMADLAPQGSSKTVVTSDEVVVVVPHAVADSWIGAAERSTDLSRFTILFRAATFDAFEAWRPGFSHREALDAISASGGVFGGERT
jgi:hypothetical protein